MFIFLKEKGANSLIVAVATCLYFIFAQYTQAAINPQIPFYGTLQDSSGNNLSGTYDMVFRFYDAASGGTLLDTSTHTAGNGNAITVTNGEFSVMLGSGTGNTLDGLDFDTANIYVGLTIESDAEMTPRERLGAAPYAFNSDTVDGYDANQLLRYNATGSISASASTPLFSIIQSGAGDIFNVFDGAAEVFSIIDGGNIGVGSSTPSRTFSIAGDFYATGALYDNNNSAGTSGYVLQSTGTGFAWVATSSLGISGGGGGSSLFTDGGATTYLTATGDNLGIGTTSSSQRLSVAGNINLDGGNAVYINDAPFFAASTTLNNIQIGLGAGNNFSNLTINNTAIGYNAAFNASTTLADYSVFIGNSAGYNSADWGNVFIGYEAGYNDPEQNNVSIGYNAGYDNTGAANVLIGSSAGYANTGTVNSIIGASAGFSNTGSFNAILVGGSDNTGDYNVISGFDAGQYNTGNRNIISGHFAGRGNVGGDNILIGWLAGGLNQGGGVIAMGPQAGYNNVNDNNIILGNTAGYNLSGESNILLGFGSGYYASSTRSILVGENTGRGIISGGDFTDSIHIGAGSGDQVISSYENVYIGRNTGFAHLYSTSSVAIGAHALGNSVQSNGTAENTAVGYRAGYNISTLGNGNVLFGYQAGDNISTGDNNVIIGYNVDAPSGSANNQLSIGNIIFGTGIDGTGTNISSGNIGIGTSSLAQKLTVAGDIRVGSSTGLGCIEDFDGTLIGGTCFSDESLKTNIAALTVYSEGSILENLVALTPVTYNWSAEAAENLHKNQTVVNIGLIAQDVEQSFPELIIDQNGIKQVKFASLQFYIIQAIKEMWEVVTGNQKRIVELEERISALEQQAGITNTASMTNREVDIVVDDTTEAEGASIDETASSTEPTSAEVIDGTDDLEQEVEPSEQSTTDTVPSEVVDESSDTVDETPINEEKDDTETVTTTEQNNEASPE